METNKILTLDISTANIGYCVFEEETQKLLMIDNIHFPDKMEIFDKIHYAIDILNEIYQKYNFKKIIVEEFLSKFSGSTAQTIIKLATFSFCIQYQLYEAYAVNIEKFYPATIKSKTGINKLKKELGIDDSKELGVMITLQDLQGTEFYHQINQKRKLKSGKNKDKEVYVEGIYDKCDAYLLGKTYFSLKA